ncbi:hypothetical protein CEXT_471811 [Caerostris extrusa]|uniref:Uncharacterized protein n=1 Tax=Caerostris extrusa TaxID=172846 RepID=A0AAV4PVQ3_CAEEX|nr:hypothetical protein CEXT_471811 [Caerostris extrusa]
MSYSNYPGCGVRLQNRSSDVSLGLEADGFRSFFGWISYSNCGGGWGGVEAAESHSRCLSLGLEADGFSFLLWLAGGMYVGIR